MKSKYIRFIALILIVCSLTLICAGCSSENTKENTTSDNALEQVEIESEKATEQTNETTELEKVPEQNGSEAYQAYMKLLKLYEEWIDCYVEVMNNFQYNPLYYLMNTML